MPTANPVPVEFRVLGPLEVRIGEEAVELGGAKRRMLLGVLLLHANEVISSDRLVDRIWGERPPKTVDKALQMHVSHLRKALAAGDTADGGRLETTPPGYVLRLEPDELDLLRFERGVADGKRALMAGDLRQGAAALREALRLWRGPPLADCSFDSAVRLELARIEELHLGALEEWIDAELALGRHADVVGELERLAAEHPLRERLLGQLMLALYRCGRQAEALDAYRMAHRHRIDELGIELGRGLQELERAILVHDPSLDAPVAPAAVHAAPASAGFVGRERELAELLEELEWARSGPARVVLVSGEPGIGKSRLTDEVAQAAAARGAQVLWGRCWEAGGAPAYWPWVQALRALVRARGRDTVRELLSGQTGELAQLLPELAPGEAPAVTDDEGARFRLFQATASLLAAAARDQPLVLVLDDLQAADAPSLLFLEFLAGADELARLLVIGTYRDVEVGPGHPLRRTVAELVRRHGTRRLALGGLDRRAVAAFMEFAIRASPADELVAAVHEQTEGNPLFVGEVVRLLASDDAFASGAPADRLAIPETVRDVIGQRLARLSPDCQEVLATASVIGREFTLPVLERVAPAPPETLVGLLDEAGGARLVAEVPGARARMRFAHVLVRDTLYAGLPSARRLRLHRDLGDALAAMQGDTGEGLAEVAHHLLESAVLGDVDRAIEAARRAAEHAMRIHAYEEAGRLLKRGLETLDDQGVADAPARCELLLGVGDARARAGDGLGAKEAFARAAALAQDAGLADALARAALGYGGRFVWERGTTDARIVPLLDAALAALPRTDSALRARVLARLSGAVRPGSERRPSERGSGAAEAAEYGREAVAIARRLGDDATLAYALEGMMIGSWRPGNASERLANAEEMIALGEKRGDLERVFSGHEHRIHTRWELGDLDGVRAEVQTVDRLAHELRQPSHLWLVGTMHSMLALSEGRLDEAETLIEETLARGMETVRWNAVISHCLERFTLCSAQGRLAELVPDLRQVAADRPTYVVLRCALANAECALGREAEGRRLFEELVRDEAAVVPFDENWLLALSLLAEPCAALGDAAGAATLYTLLEPYADLVAIGPPDTTTDSAARPLGLLAAIAGERAAALAHFERALEVNERLGALPSLAHTYRDLARLLLEGASEDGRSRGREAAARALEIYESLGMDSFARGAAQLAG